MIPATVTTELERALRGLQYGTIQLVVHDAQIVRIERVERIRLTTPVEASMTTSGQPTAPTEVRHRPSEGSE